MSSTSFDSLYNQLNVDQKKAVDAIEGAVLVVAGPGTGKTQMLTLRIANILKKTDAKPENILALTFTESGVAAMRKRLLSIIGSVAYQVNIFTFHGFSNYLIQTNPEDFSEYIDAQPVTELEQVEILEGIFQANQFELIKPFGAEFHYLKAAKSSISELKKEGVTPDSFLKILDNQKQDFDQIPDLYNEKGRWAGKMKGKYQKVLKSINKNYELLEVYRQYQAKLSELNYYDYDDMLLTVIAHLSSDEDLLMRLQEQYQYFLVDEHQDTNAAQNKIVELLASFHPNPNLFAVGDEKQAIYRFQGASLTNFLYFKQLYQDAEIVTLETNYRSTQKILDSSHSLISHSEVPEDIEIPLRTQLQAYNQETAANLKIVDCAEYHGEYQWVAQDIASKIEAGVSPEEIAVLSRNNADLSEATAALGRLGVPYVLEGKNNILEDLQILKLLKIFEAVVHYGEDIYLLPVLCIDFLAIHPMDLFILRSLAKENKKSIWEIVSEIEKYEVEFRDLENLKKVFEQLSSWYTLTKNQSLDVVFTTILKESGVLKQSLSNPNFKDSLDTFIALYQIVRSKIEKKPQFSLEDLLQFLHLLEDHNLNIETKTSATDKEAVRLMTAHGSKGLEFEYVYILNAYDGKWGNKRGNYDLFKLPYEYMGTVASDLDEDDKNGDDRRLFYVALTRAKQEVTVSYAKQHTDGKELVPSQFLSELDQELIETVDTTEFDLDFGNNKEVIFDQKEEVSSQSQDYLDELKPVVNDIFDRVGLSVSALNNYLTCPWRYFFRNLIRLPEAKTESLIFGSAVHDTIHWYVLNRNKDIEVEDLLSFFDSYLENQALTTVQLETIKQKGKDVFEVYYPERMKHWSDGVQSEVKISGVGVGKDIKLTGKLDMIEPTGDAGQYRVYDFKTGKPKSRNWIEGKNKNTTGDYKRQLVFYQLLMDKHLAGSRKMVEGILEFVQPNDRGKLKSETFIITSEETAELEDTITNVAKEIRGLEFWERRCDDEACEYCKLRDMMGG